jgi:hypothetical protein
MKPTLGREHGAVSSPISPLLVLLPPSEGKALEGTGAPWSPDQGIFGAQLAPARHQVIGALATQQGGTAKLLGVNGRYLDYRLKAAASLAPLGKLSSWWRPQLTAVLARHARRRFIVDLLPNEHRAALDTSGLNGVAVVIRHRSGASAGHGAKAAKGQLARHLLTFDGPARTALDTWRHDLFELELTAL